jgi:hypothetical protein
MAVAQAATVRIDSPPITYWPNIIGWTAVMLNLCTSSFWAVWGSVAGFHEGWWHPALDENVVWTLAYLVPSAIFVLLGLVAIRWPKLGAIILVGFTGSLWWYSRPPHVLGSANFDLAYQVMMVMGGLLALLWWGGRPEPIRWAYKSTWLIPLLTAVGTGAYPASLVLTRVDDGNYGARLIHGNHVNLVWAPQGPGWPMKGAVNWTKASQIVDHLSRNGLVVKSTPQHYWRLPTLSECVRSAVRHGSNAGGTIGAGGVGLHYQNMPDKETPLWNPHSEVIYWWTSDAAPRGQGWSYCYNGSVLAQGPNAGTGFRAVRR